MSKADKMFEELGYTKGGETMTNIEKVNKALATADESKIKEVLDFLGYKEDNKFIPEIDERYYFINSLGTVIFQRWRDDEYDNYVLLMNSVYRTEEEAEQALDFQTRKAKLIKEIENSSDAIDWSNGYQSKYFLFYDLHKDGFGIDYSISQINQGAIYTTNRDFIKDLIATRSDEVKELLFGVKS